MKKQIVTGASESSERKSDAFPQIICQKQWG